MNLTGTVDAPAALCDAMAVLGELPAAADEVEAVDRISLLEC